MKISNRAEFTRFCVQLVAAHGGVGEVAHKLHYSPRAIHRALTAFLPKDEHILVDIAMRLSGRVVIPERCYVILDIVVEEDG